MRLVKIAQAGSGGRFTGGGGQEVLPLLKVPPISERGTVLEIAPMFGGAEKLRTAVNEMQALLYS
jgi:type I restriction enzyme R subunit